MKLKPAYQDKENQDNFLSMFTKEQFMDKAECQFKHDHDKTNSIPFSLRLDHIATTFLAWSKEHHLDLPTGGKKYVNCISHEFDGEDDKENKVANAISPSKQSPVPPQTVLGLCRTYIDHGWA
eukprot:13339535-Ditylum_brightwellii.AAC.1